MRATGIVRRIDELGRIVIPIEIRRDMNIRDGDPLEIYVAPNGEVILKKYSAIADMKDFVQGMAQSLYETTGHLALITDRDQVVAVAGGKESLEGKPVGEVVLRAMENRETLFFTPRDHHEGSLLGEQPTCPFQSEVIVPIVIGGDPVGTVILASDDPEKDVSQLEVKLAQTAAGFMARHLEE
ncbi:MAG: AbrB/MazE/SpoVT family DNA-binding domain-containing protein [Clostridiales bacterium]|nr:AbrB/MazE/SpoVT family DNA-binding domain-containing protein [Clostridiales bacterium]